MNRFVSKSFKGNSLIRRKNVNRSFFTQRIVIPQKQKHYYRRHYSNYNDLYEPSTIVKPAIIATAAYAAGYYYANPKEEKEEIQQTPTPEEEEGVTTTVETKNFTLTRTSTTTVKAPPMKKAPTKKATRKKATKKATKKVKEKEATTTPAAATPPVEVKDDTVIIDSKYDTLPEEDEETHCSICRTNRQGPCRPFWRKFEACMKDNSPQKSKEDSSGEKGNSSEIDSSTLSEKCDTYMFPWFECTRQHPNLYLMLMNQTSQYDFVEEYESFYYFGSTGKEKMDIKSWKVSIPHDINATKLGSFDTMKDYYPEINNYKTNSDWFVAIYKKYFENDDNVDYYQRRKVEQNKNNNKDTLGSPVKQNLYDASTYQGNPTLIDLAVRIPLYYIDNEKKKYELDMCYVKDQNGTMLGYDNFQSSLQPQKDENGNNIPMPTEEALRFHIEPGKTTSLRFYKSYRQIVEKNNNTSIEKKEETKEEETKPKEGDDKKKDGEDNKKDGDDKKEETPPPPPVIVQPFVSESIPIIEILFHNKDNVVEEKKEEEEGKAEGQKEEGK